MERYKTGNVELFRLWERQGQPKIALKVKDISEMVSVQAYSAQAAAPGQPLLQHVVSLSHRMQSGKSTFCIRAITAASIPGHYSVPKQHVLLILLLVMVLLYRRSWRRKPSQQASRCTLYMMQAAHRWRLGRRRCWQWALGQHPWWIA